MHCENRFLKIEGKKSLFVLKFIIKSIFLYAGLSAAFSIIGLFPIFGDVLPRPYLVGNPLEISGISIEHVAGHIVFGLIVGAASLGVRYMIIAGLLPMALDADHLVHFLNIDSIPRMGHSFAFALISFPIIPIMMYLLGKKDYRLGAISIAAVLTHISFDILLSEPSGTRFPILIPFSNKMITLIGLDWVVFLASAVIVVACGMLLDKRYQQSTNLTDQNHN
ncbi:MAG: hypothetical protein EB161_01815 [Nitrosopumilaceae archaeon]|nr:hypothetical protein [Nitrosopumilaceae archaeon]